MIRLFENFPQIICAISDKKDNNLSFKFGNEKVIDSRKKFLKNFNLSLDNLVAAKQIHSNNIKIVDNQDKGKGAYAKDCLSGYDGLVTDKKNLILAVEAADCLPLFLFEPENEIIGAVHIGWRCAAQNIIGQLAKSLKSSYDVELNKFHLAIGPHIGQCCFEVGKEVFEKFFGYKKRFQQKNNMYFADLAGIVKDQLKDQGFDLHKLQQSKHCTCCDHDLYSFRQEKKQLAGQHLGIITMID